ncbi:GGDEF domain-containing protein [Paenibacillus sp. SN-8-1]|uniref:GGDEF domain-containing protein n=1 Tax=Paenibacillus sp. SN-8-1 TaxID=3435409 RepID=UPI003D9A889D
MNGYWGSAIILLAAQWILFENHSTLSPGIYESTFDLKYLISDFIILLTLIVSEILLRTRQEHVERIVLVCGLSVSYLVFYILFPFLNGAEIVLILPILLSLVYFSWSALYSSGLLSLMFLCLNYLFVHPNNQGDDWFGFLMAAIYIILVLLIGRAVLARSHELRNSMETLVKSEQKLIVEKAISDKLIKIDALTGLYNHKTFHEYLENLILHCETNGVSLHLALIDIDNFKKVNDTYGHWVGDIVLKDAAGCITELLNPNNFAARYGGEEFAVIFTDTTAEEAAEQAEQIRQKIESLPLSHSREQPVTVSIGVCTYQPGNGKELLFRNTDNALYTAKRAGKNRVVFHQPAE